MVAGPYLSNRLFTHSGMSRSALYTRCTIQNGAHGNPKLSSEHSAVNGIFVQPLYGPVQVNGGGPCTFHTGSVHILGSFEVPCTLGVRLGMALMAMHHWAVNNGTFVHPLCGAIKLHGGGPSTSLTGSVYIMGSPVVPYSLGVRLRTTIMAMHHSAVNTLPPTELLYTRCAEL